MTMRPALLAAALVAAWPVFALAHGAGHDVAGQRLATLGPAPDFALLSQDGRLVSLADFRGKVLAVAFIYTTCPDVCPMLTAHMVQVQDALGQDFGTSVAFVSITVDPARDTPDVLKQYAAAYGADFRGWTFLTGEPSAIADVAKRYGVFAMTGKGGEIDHTLLTSVVDQAGILRVQYVGARFDPEEFRGDLLKLLGEPR